MNYSSEVRAGFQWFHCVDLSSSCHIAIHNHPFQLVMVCYITSVAVIVICMHSSRMQITSLPYTLTSTSIVLLATGGTISALAQDHANAHVYKEAQVDIQHLLPSLPPIPNCAVEAIQYIRIGSENFSSKVLLQLRKEIQMQLRRPQVHALVLTQGTDTIEDTAFFLHCSLPQDKPIIITGAMRPPGTPGSDAPMNLFHALSLARQTRRAGVWVVMGERIHHASRVRKSHTMALDAFESTGNESLGFMLGDKPHWFTPMDHGEVRSNTTHMTLETLRRFQHNELPPVAVVWGHADLSSKAALEMAQGFGGMVFIGTGNGTIPEQLKPALRQLTSSGCAVVRASRVASGPVVRNAAANDDELGTLAAGWCSVSKAKLLLQLALSCGLESQSLQRVFDSI
jgi:L-asparaginase type II